VDGDQLGAVGKHAFDLQDRHHRGDAGSTSSVDRMVEPSDIIAATLLPRARLRESRR